MAVSTSPDAPAGTTASRSTAHGRQSFEPSTGGQQVQMGQAVAQSSPFEPRPQLPLLVGAPLSPGEEESFVVSASTLTTSWSQPVVQPSDIVFGIPCENKELSGVVRRVILIASFGATTYICRFVIDLMVGVYSQRSATKLWSAMSSLLLELSVPACGYFGALHHNRQLTCCFCSCNLCISVITALSFVRLNLWAAGLEGGCEGRSSSAQQQTCELWTTNSAEKFVMFISMVLIAITGMAAFWFGNKLFQHLSRDFYVATPTPVVGQVTTIPTLPAPSASDRVLVASEMSRSIPRHTATNRAGLPMEMVGVTVAAAGVRHSTRSPSQISLRSI